MSIKKIEKYFRNPILLWNRLCAMFPNLFVNDERFIKLRWSLSMNYKLDLNNPKTYSEKLQWLKLNNRNPLYTQMVDKIGAKEYVAEKIGKQYIIPTIATYDNVNEIDWASLPNQFVIKCTHDSGGLVICKDKSKLDIQKAKAKLASSLKTDNYTRTREWPYKNVPRRLICEKYMVDESGVELKDYKFLCFNGVPQVMFIASGRASNDVRFNYYDMAFSQLDFKQSHLNINGTVNRPKCFDEMKAIATKLSEGIPHVRVDLYEIDGKVYFGELTFFHFSGFSPFYPEKWDRILGDMLVLPKN